MTDLLWTHLRWADLLLTHIRTTVFSDDSDLLLTSIWSAVFPYDSWVTPDSHLVSCFPIWLSYSWLTFGHLFSHMTELLLTHIKSVVFPYDWVTPDSHLVSCFPYDWVTPDSHLVICFPIWLSYSWLTSGQLFSHMTLTWVTPDSYQVITFTRRLLFPIWCHLTSISAIFMKRTILQTIRSWHFTKIKYTIIHVLNTSD
jgi:hypothetical protein